jgi:hypothetical protein
MYPALHPHKRRVRHGYLSVTAGPLAYPKLPIRIAFASNDIVQERGWDVADRRKVSKRKYNRQAEGQQAIAFSS